MECNNKKCTCFCGACKLWTVIISIIVGVAVATLFILDLIPITLNFITIALIMSVIGMAIIFVSLFFASMYKRCNGVKKCVCSKLNCLLIGVIGTFLNTTISAIIGVTVSSIAAAIFVGLSALFFALMMLQIILLIKCLIKEICSSNINE